MLVHVQNTCKYNNHFLSLESLLVRNLNTYCVNCWIVLTIYKLASKSDNLVQIRQQMDKFTTTISCSYLRLYTQAKAFLQMLASFVYTYTYHVIVVLHVCQWKVLGLLALKECTNVACIVLP